MDAPYMHMIDVIPRTRFLTRWEYLRAHNVPRPLVQCMGEFIGVWLYVWLGIGSTASFIFTNLGQQPGLGSLFQVGCAFGIGIVCAIVVCASTSGGHLNPCVTLAQAMFRGFPWKKVPLYITAQILGAYVACLTVYFQYKDVIEHLESTLILNGTFDSVFFTPSGPAGIFALYANPGKPLGIILFNEFVIDFALGLIIWASLDPTNFYVPPSAVQWTIGLAYSVCIWGFGPATLAANTARDLGSRFMALTIWGTRASGGKYAAIAALTNFPAMILAVVIYEIVLMDSCRVLPPSQREFFAGQKASVDLRTDALPEDYKTRFVENGYHPRDSTTTMYHHNSGIKALITMPHLPSLKTWSSRRSRPDLEQGFRS